MLRYLLFIDGFEDAGSMRAKNFNKDELYGDYDQEQLSSEDESFEMGLYNV